MIPRDYLDAVKADAIARKRTIYVYVRDGRPESTIHVRMIPPGSCAIVTSDGYVYPWLVSS